MAVETGAGVTGGWVAEGAAIPVQKTAFRRSHSKSTTSMTLIDSVVGGVATGISDPDAEATIRRTVLGKLAGGD